MKKQKLIILISGFATFIFVFVFLQFGIKSELDGPQATTPTALNKKSKNINNHSSDVDLGINQSHKSKGIKDRILTKTKSGQMVVDQTLKRSLSNGGGEDDSEKFEIVNEIILIDGATNLVLKNYRVAVNFTFDNILADMYTVEINRLKSDSNGKITFKTKKAGILNMVIISDTYAVLAQKVLVGYGKNEYKAKLYKGGILEIHATNEDNEIVNGLMVDPQDWIYDEIISSFKPLSFDAQRGLYTLINLLGTTKLTFHAKGYNSTEVYQINIAPNQKSYLEIRLQRPRKILLSLDLDNKPEKIKVSECINKTYFLGGEEVKENEKSSSQKFELTKNKNNVYEYELNNTDVSGIVVYVDGYIPQILRFVTSTDIYHLHLEKSFEGKIRVINEKGSPIVGAEISYFVAPLFEDDRKDFNGSVDFSHFNPEPIKTITGENGIATLKNLKEKMVLCFSVSHLECLNANINWEFDAEKENLFTITLSESINITGKIMYAEKPVLGAKVFLFYKNNEIPQEKMETNEEGNYSFKYSKNGSARGYHIKAFHQKYGVGVVSLESKDFSKPIDIYLAKEKSILIKLEDEKGLSLPNKSMSIVNSNLSYQYIFSTNHKGEYEFFNLEHGSYLLRSNEDALVTTGSESISFVVPSITLTVNLEKRDLKKVKVKLSNGEIYKGQLNVTIFVGYNIRYDFKYDNNGDRFLDFAMGPEAIYTLDAPGYAPIFLGPYVNPSKIPSEFNLELQKGETLKITVVDSLDNKPLPYVSVAVSNDYGNSSTLPTNQNGEVIFSNLNAFYKVYVKEYDYIRIIEKVDVTQTKEMEFRLIRCGRLKCNSKPRKAGHLLSFLFRDVPYILDSNGNVEIDNIEPGQYPITIEEMGVNKSEDKSPTDPKVFEIVVESNKTTEIDLDIYLEK